MLDYYRGFAEERPRWEREGQMACRDVGDARDRRWTGSSRILCWFLPVLSISFFYASTSRDDLNENLPNFGRFLSVGPRLLFLNQALPLSNSLVGVSLPLGECMVCRLADERHGILSNTLGCILKEVGDLCI